MPPIDFRAHIRVPTDATGPVVAGLGAAEAADERMRTPPATEWLPPLTRSVRLASSFSTACNVAGALWSVDR